MADQFAQHAKPRQHCAERHLLLATGANLLTDVPDAIYCLASGSVTLTDADGATIAYPAITGQMIPFRNWTPGERANADRWGDDRRPLAA